MQIVGTYHVVKRDEGVIDGHNRDISLLDGSSGYQTTNTAKSENSQEKISILRRI